MSVLPHGILLWMRGKVSMFFICSVGLRSTSGKDVYTLFRAGCDEALYVAEQL